jgi:[acyl-carrier-protein] S-malonyltransferase
MDRAAAAAPGGMLGVTGLGPRAIDALCADTGLSIAIRIDVDAVVLGGRVDALARAERIATARNAKCSRLPIEVASHTPSMAGAAGAFEAALQAVRMQAPKVALFTNAADRVHTAEAASQALSRQIAQTVEWTHCLDGIHARQPSCVLEIGPGAALAAMWNRRHPDVPARSADEFRSADAVVDWVSRHVDR